MEDRTLRVFITVAEQLNFRKASEIRNMTPSAVSRAIQRIEEEIGVILFVRDNKCVCLTDDGRVMLDYAKDRIEKLDNISNSLKHKTPETLQGSLTIASTVTFITMIPKLVKAFTKKYPNISINIVTGSSYKNIEGVMSGEYDFIIQSCGGVNSDQTVAFTLGKSDLVLIGPKGAPKIKKLKQLKSSPYIMSQFPDLSVITKQIFSEVKFKANITSYVDGHEAIISMVSGGLGYSLVPLSILANSPLHDEVQAHYVEGLPQVDAVIRTRKQKYYDAVHTSFRNHITESASDTFVFLKDEE